MSASLSTGTVQRVALLFTAADRELVTTLLIQDCGNSLPDWETADPVRLERIRFAVLKLSGGDLNAFQRALDLAKTDWRDALMAAGFGEDPQAHKTWWPGDPKVPGAS